MLARLPLQSGCRALTCAPRSTIFARAASPLLYQSAGALPSHAESARVALAASTIRREASSLPGGGAAGGPLLNLGSLADNPGAHKKRKRKGRGEGSGMGKTAGRGMKGNTARSGGAVSLGFEGGQTPLWRRTPKIGPMLEVFQSPVLEGVPLSRLQLWIDTGRIDPNSTITMKTLVDSGLVTKTLHGIKLLATGGSYLSRALHIEVTAASAGAIAAVEAQGGSVKSVYYTPLALRALLKPEKFDLPIKAPRPPPKKMAYYTSYASRGYLSPEVQLKELKRRLATGMDIESAAALHPVFVGGPVELAGAMGMEPTSARTLAAAAAASATAAVP